MAQLEEHDKILKSVRSALPKTLARHVFYCVVKEKKLLLYTESAAWASQLRFNSQLILETVNTQSDAAITQVKVRIHLKNNCIENSARVPLIPTPETIEAIRSDTLYVPDSDLKEALIRLSETLKAR